MHPRKRTVENRALLKRISSDLHERHKGALQPELLHAMQPHQGWTDCTPQKHCPEEVILWSGRFLSPRDSN